MNLRTSYIKYSLAGLMIFSLPVPAESPYENPVLLQASQILEKDIVSGPHHRVDESVSNDGYLNTYTIHSDFGDVQVTSTAKLRKYVREINAVAKMKEIRSSDEFKKGMAEKAESVVAGTKALVSDPAGTLSGTVSGVGKLFSRAQENLLGDARSDAEGGRMESLLGYEKAKRDIGYKFGVDVYSDNKILQDELKELAGASGTGTLVMSGLLMAIPGAGGAVVSVTGGAEMMADTMRDQAPADQRMMNRNKLQAMGVSADISDVFIANGTYTPREQTFIVAALDNMRTTKNRGEFIKFATLTDNADTAFFRQRQAQMYEAYNRTVEPIERFVPTGELTAGMSANGKLVFNVPLDHLVWTKDLAALASVVTRKTALMSEVKERHLWVTGTVSPLAKASLEQMGWTVHAGQESLLSQAEF